MGVSKNLTHRQKEILSAFSRLSPRGEKIAYEFVMGLNDIYPAIKAEVIPINFNQNRGKRA